MAPESPNSKEEKTGKRKEIDPSPQSINPAAPPELRHIPPDASGAVFVSPSLRRFVGVYGEEGGRRAQVNVVY